MFFQLIVRSSTFLPSYNFLSRQLRFDHLESLRNQSHQLDFRGVGTPNTNHYPRCIDPCDLDELFPPIRNQSGAPIFCGRLRKGSIVCFCDRRLLSNPSSSSEVKRTVQSIDLETTEIQQVVSYKYPHSIQVQLAQSHAIGRVDSVLFTCKEGT